MRPTVVRDDQAPSRSCGSLSSVCWEIEMSSQKKSEVTTRKKVEPVVQHKSKSAAIRTSLIVAAILAAMTIVEYFVALAYSGAALLLLLGLVKAFFVVNFYMHISRLWAPDGGH